MRPEVRGSSPIQWVLKLQRAFASGNFVRFFKLLRQAPYLLACLSHIFFGQVCAACWRRCGCLWQCEEVKRVRRMCPCAAAVVQVRASALRTLGETLAPKAFALELSWLMVSAAQRLHGWCCGAAARSSC